MEIHSVQQIRRFSDKFDGRAEHINLMENKLNGVETFIPLSAKVIFEAFR